MTPILPIHVAASGLEGLIWLVVGIIWLVFQGLANAAKKKAPPAPRPTPTAEQSEQPFGNEWRDLIETLTGQKNELQGKEEAVPTLPPPAPARATQFSRQPAPTRRATPPPVLPLPAQWAAEAGQSPAITAQLPTTQIHWRVAPLLRMKWPRSPLGNLSVTAATRAGHTSPLHRRLMGAAALRQAMVSRIVLGPPGGR
jgi:hypothetical protein